MKRPLLYFALSYVLGVFFCLHALPAARQLWTALSFLLMGAGLAWFWRRKRAITLVVAVGLSFGILWMWGYSKIVFAPMERFSGTEMDATLEVIEYPQKQGYGAGCAVRVEGMSGRMMYYGDDALLELSPGDKLQGTVICYSAAEVNGQKSTYYTSQRISLRLYPKDEMTLIKRTGTALRYLPQRLKHALHASIETVFSKEAGGLILALLTGERSAMDEQSITDLEESGLIHLTAVSGLHCGFLIAFMGLLVGGNRFLRALVSYPVLLIYVFMVGCTPSVVRACVMVGFSIAAPIFDRDNDPPTSLGAAALVILLVNPYAIASVSFQLSFAAVAGLLAVSPRIFAVLNGIRRWKKRSIRLLWSAFSASVSASVGALIFTAPISAYYFKTISIVSPLSNLLVLPVIQILFAFALLLTLACMVFPGAAVLAFIPELMVDYVLWVAGITSKIPGHSVSFLSITAVMWFVLVYSMFAVCWISKDGRRKYVFAAVLSTVSLCAVRVFPVMLVSDDELTVVAVDVGQGAATLLHSEDMTVLVDCGTYYSPRGSGACVSDTMQMYGWDALDYVILTHYHEDHAGGIDELLARVRVDTFLLPRASGEDGELHDGVIALAQRYGVTVSYVDEVTVAVLGNAEITVYPQLTFGKTNEEGLTILCTAGEFDVLITGDMGMSTERLLIETYKLPDIEVLMVGHHGSKYSTSAQLLKETMPEAGIISVGENSYGHPTEEAMGRLTLYDCDLYRTDLQGNIIIQVHG